MRSTEVGGDLPHADSSAGKLDKEGGMLIFFDKERGRLLREITSSFEELLSSTNVLNRKFEEVLGMTKEYQTIATLWQNFQRLMYRFGTGEAESEKDGVPGTGGHVVSTTHRYESDEYQPKQSKATVPSHQA